jgi:hypothetical protein
MSAHRHDHERSAAVSRRVTAIVAELERKGVTSERELDDLVRTFLEKARPENGYRIVARAWIDQGFKDRLLTDANSAAEELGVELPERTDVLVWDSTAEARYMVLPRRPAGTESLNEAQLAALVTRNGLIGTALL